MKGAKLTPDEEVRLHLFENLVSYERCKTFILTDDAIFEFENLVSYERCKTGVHEVKLVTMV